MTAERIRFRLNVPLSILPPLLFLMVTAGWVVGLVLYWMDVTWLVRAFAILFVAWLATWWVRFGQSVRAWLAGDETLFVNLPWEIVLGEDAMHLRGFLLNLRVRPDQVLDVGGEFPGLRRIVVKHRDQNRVLNVFGSREAMDRVLEWCFYNGVELSGRDQRM